MQQQRDRVLSYINIAKQEGTRCVLGGEVPEKRDVGNGWFVKPTIFADVNNQRRIAQEEVFGPVLSVMPFESEEEAVQIANSTDYGLAAGVWTSDLSRAHRMLRRIQSGVVHINCYGGADITVPLGGLKQSGNGHDKSMHALDKFTAIKTGWISL